MGHIKRTKKDGEEEISDGSALIEEKERKGGLSTDELKNHLDGERNGVIC